MWKAMEKSGIEKPMLTEAQTADLFGYFWASRYFEKPGDEARGRRVFASKRCTECHVLPFKQRFSEPFSSQRAFVPCGTFSIWLSLQRQSLPYQPPISYV